MKHISFGVSDTQALDSNINLELLNQYKDAVDASLLVSKEDEKRDLDVELSLYR